MVIKRNDAEKMKERSFQPNRICRQREGELVRAMNEMSGRQNLKQRG